MASESDQTSSTSSNDSPDQTSSASSNNGPPVNKIEPLKLPTFEEIRGQEMWNNCAVRSVFSGVLGGGLGIFMGLFLGALDNPLMQEQMTARQQFIYTAKQMGSRSWGSAKAFAIMGLIFSGVECAVEKARAKHDTTNTAVAGCVTGGTLSARDSELFRVMGCGLGTWRVSAKDMGLVFGRKVEKSEPRIYCNDLSICVDSRVQRLMIFCNLYMF